MEEIDFTDETSKAIKNQNSKNYKKREKALMEHFCDEVKKLSQYWYDPLCIIYAWHWLREIITGMKKNRETRNSELNPMLKNIDVNKLSLNGLIKKLEKMVGGFNSSWNNQIKQKVLSCANCLDKNLTKMERNLGVKFDKISGTDIEIPLKKFIPLEKKRQTWDNQINRIIGNAKYYGEEDIKNYWYKIKTNLTSYSNKLNPATLYEGYIIKK